MGYTVYKHTSPSNKVYIGITMQKVSKRWQNGRGYIANTYFYRAIQKYGWNNIKHEILYENLNKEDAQLIEIELIKEYKSYDYHFGYNLSLGGELGRSKPVNKYSIDGTFLKSYETLVEASNIENIPSSNIIACCNGSSNTANGYVWRYEGDSFDKFFQTIPRISKSGKLFVVAYNEDYLKPIYKYNKLGDLLATYKNVYEIKEYNTDVRSRIIRCCNKEIKSAVGFVWRFEKDDKIKESVIKIMPSLRKRIAQYDTNGNYIKTWDSITEARNYYNIRNIDSVLCGNRHTAGGFVWRYDGDSFNKYDIQKKKPNIKRKYDNMPVYQYDMDWNFIRSYNTVYDIDKKDFVYGNVVKCLVGEIHYTNGYRFSFSPQISKAVE